MERAQERDGISFFQWHKDLGRQSEKWSPGPGGTGTVRYDVDVLNVTQIDKGGISLNDYKAIVLGSATYHGEMLQSMKTFLFLAAKANLGGKAGGAFGAFAWSEEASWSIFDTMKYIFKMNMVWEPLRLKFADLGYGIKMAQDYGREIARKELASA
jgi:flavorubredoxin